MSNKVKATEKTTAKAYFLKSSTIKELNKFSKEANQSEDEIVNEAINEHIDRSKK
jgi:hypothetical protein